MNLKQHNNIVQKLIEEIQTKDKEITKLNKLLTQQAKQLSSNQSNKPTESVQTQKLIQKRIAQLNKQHQHKLSTLNQQIKTLTQQNTQLKQRLNLKISIQNKEKQRIAQVLKKSVVERKPGTKQDYKISALISHYEAQMERKNSYIETLKRQLKSINSSSNCTLNKKDRKSGQILFGVQLKYTSNPKKQEFNQQQQQDMQVTNADQSLKTVSLVQHNKELQRLKRQLQRSNNMLSANKVELQKVKNNYNQLTKQYYRVVNQYGVAKANNNNNTKKIGNTTINRSGNNNNNCNANHDMSSSSFSLNITQQQNEQNNSSLSLQFQQNFKRFINRPKLNSTQQLLQQQSQQQFYQHTQNQHNKYTSQVNIHNQNISHQNKINKNTHNQYLQSLQQLIQSILSLLNLTQKQQIIPYLTDLTIKSTFHSKNQVILSHLHQFLYRFGMGKVSKNQMVQVLTQFETKILKYIESNDLLDEICIEIGAKRPKIISKIQSYKNLQIEYNTKLRNVQFLTQLNKSQKVLQFIEFFELDKSNLQLPQQLKNIYQQLKHVDKFIKLANSTLGIEIKDRKGLQFTLQIILKKLQKYYEWQIQIEKQNQRKTQNQTNYKKYTVKQRQ